MSDEGAVEKVLLRAGGLRFLGRNRAFITLLFAVWAARKKAGLASNLKKLTFLVGGRVASGIGTGSSVDSQSAR
jgi:hypothetical protein